MLPGAGSKYLKVFKANKIKPPSPPFISSAALLKAHRTWSCSFKDELQKFLYWAYTKILEKNPKTTQIGPLHFWLKTMKEHKELVDELWSK